MNKIYYILILLLALACLCCVILGNIAHHAPVVARGKATIEVPFYFEDSSERWGEITDFAVCDSVLYVFYDNKELLDCYDLDGNYLHSYSFVLGDKGASELFVRDGVLYVKSRELTFYTFTNGLFMESFRVTAMELYPLMQSLDGSKQCSEGEIFKLRGASIWCGSQKVLHRSAWMNIFQGNKLLVVGPVCFILICFLMFVYRRQFMQSKSHRGRYETVEKSI